MDESIELMAMVFPSKKQAGEALDRLKGLRRDSSVRWFSAATIEKSESGRAVVHEVEDASAWRGALFGAVVGALVGLLSGPAGAVVGAAAGAATGGAAASQIDLGFSHEFLKSLEESLQPGTSLLLLLADERHTGPLVQVLAEYPGNLLRHVLQADLVKQISEDASAHGTH